MMKAKNKQNSITKTNSVVQSTKGMIAMDSDLKRILSGPQSNNVYSDEKCGWQFSSVPTSEVV